jgi:hypothetical protein
VSTALTPPMPGKNKYIVWDSSQDRFIEFPIKLGETQVGNFLEILVAPPIKRVGFLSYNKQVFHLSINDLLRNHFNVSKPYIQPTGETSTGSPTNVGSQSLIGPNQRSIEASTGNELDKESSVYWQEQVRSLFYYEDSEEGWNMEETTQS